ncbi:MAG: hypothetical protein IPI50_12260 [Saprospiraceae bacterium]|nr:hypothetical protein [Saprospiraceae bacterium]
MHRIKSIFYKIIILTILVFNPINYILAQCPMCKMAAESNMKDGGLAGQGLNNGILYLLVIPYILAFTLIYLYRKSRKQVDS